jgi:hypothetical protein
MTKDADRMRERLQKVLELARRPSGEGERLAAIEAVARIALGAVEELELAQGHPKAQPRLFGDYPSRHEGDSRPRRRKTGAVRTAIYRGNEYRVLYIGLTKYGHRAYLEFLDGSKAFWCDAEQVQELQTSTRKKARK